MVFYDDWYAVDIDNDFNPEPDGNEYREVVYKDPDDINTKSYSTDPDIEDSGATISYVCPFVPTPVADYLNEIKWQDEDWIPIRYYQKLNSLGGAYDSELDEDDFTWDWSVDGNVITCESSFAMDDDPETASWEGDTEIEDYIGKWTFDENTGMVSISQIMNNDEEILYETRIVSAITRYELPILLWITAASVIGIIYIIRKRT
ncbi:MAG: hypothetical protein ACFFAN_08345 [Promethearchaeota archaeon]